MARYITWTPATGAPLVLTDPAAGYRVLAAGTRGLWAPPYRMESERYAGLPGSTLTAVEADEREVGLGVTVTGTTADEFRARWRALARALRPTAGDGTLTVTDEGGFARTLACRYAGGLEGDAADQSSGVLGTAVVRLVAHDPWWYGPEQTIDVGLAAPANFFPIPPLVLAASTIQGTFTVDLSDSDAPTYPAWTITGPGSQLTLRNDTTGAELVLNAAVGDGQLVVIDTRPGRQSIRRATPGAVTTVERRRNWHDGRTAGYFGATITTDTDTATSYNGRSTYRTVTDSAVNPQGIIGWADPAIPDAVGAAVAFRVAVRAESAVTVNVSAREEGSGGVTETFAQQVTLTAGAWRELTFTQTVTRADLTQIGVQAVLTAAASGVTLRMSRPLIEAAAVAGDYFDGDSPDGARGGDVVHAWTGTAGASPSTQSVITAVAPPVLGENLFGSLASDPALWPLVDGTNVVTALLTNAGPASRIRGTYRARYSGI